MKICIVENLHFSDSRTRLVIVLTAGLQVSFDVAEIALLGKADPLWSTLASTSKNVGGQQRNFAVQVCGRCGLRHA